MSNPTGNALKALNRDPFIDSNMRCNPARCGNGKCYATSRCQALLMPAVQPVPTLAPIVAGESVCCNKTVRMRCAGCPHLPIVNSPPLAPAADAPRVLLAFTGLAGAGKSTAAAHLVDHHGFQRVRFAGPLKAMMAALGLTTAQIDGSEKETPCALLGGKTPRWAMQTIGSEWGRDLISPDLWIRAWEAALAKVPAGVSVVVDDARFPNEAAAITAAGGVLVRIDRDGAGTASVHQSEQHQLPTTATLHNTAAPAVLFEQVDTLLRDLSWVA